MGQLRIRWGWLARGAGVLAGGLVALQVLPGVLAPPEAPPLAADVGLPRVGQEGRGEIVPREQEVRTPDTRPVPKSRSAPKPRSSRGVSAATAIIGSTPRHEGPGRNARHGGRDEARPRPPRPTPPPRPAPPDAPPTPSPATPAPAAEPAPAAPAPVPSPAPEDGSLEFAPR